MLRIASTKYFDYGLRKSSNNDDLLNLSWSYTIKMNAFVATVNTMCPLLVCCRSEFSLLNLFVHSCANTSTLQNIQIFFYILRYLTFVFYHNSYIKITQIIRLTSNLECGQKHQKLTIFFIQDPQKLTLSHCFEANQIKQ